MEECRDLCTRPVILMSFGSSCMSVHKHRSPVGFIGTTAVAAARSSIPRLGSQRGRAEDPPQTGENTLSSQQQRCNLTLRVLLTLVHPSTRGGYLGIPKGGEYNFLRYIPFIYTHTYIYGYRCTYISTYIYIYTYIYICIYIFVFAHM